MEFCIGLITHGKIQPGLFVYDALIMGKGIKAGFSVIRTHSALAKTAKSHFTGGQMNDGVIDAASAKATGLGDFFCQGLFFRKKPEDEVWSLQCLWLVPVRNT